MASERVLGMLDKEVEAGWQFALPIDSLKTIPEVIVAPVDAVVQSTIDGEGKTIEKVRLTHDQSFTFSSTTSVNSCMQLQALPECKFGWTFRRILLRIVWYRYRHPKAKTVLSKTDFKSAYRRLMQDGLLAS